MMRDMQAQRLAMVDSQLRTDRVTDQRLLDAMAEIPRERFVPDRCRDIAYIDEDIPIGHGRYMLEPRVFARLVQAAEISESDVVLDVGCGAGYSATVLGRLAQAVVAVESAPELIELAGSSVDEADQDNIVFQRGQLADGWPGQAPYDAIFINGAVQQVPETLLSQLAEGGRLCTVLRPDDGPGRAVVMLRADGQVSQRPIFDASVPALAEFNRTRGFVFS